MGEELAIQLEQQGWQPILISRKLNRVARLLDMLCVIINQRNNYSIGEVDIFSGPAFIWGYLSALIIKQLKKPLILTLHGGNLPLFALKYPRIVKSLLCLADTVIAPSSYLVKKMILYRPDIRLIPNAVEISQYSFRLREKPRLKLVWLRAFHQIYNPLLATKVVKILENQKLNPHLLMVRTR